VPEWIKRAERVKLTERRREFAYEGHVVDGRSMWGFSFPVDEDGNPIGHHGSAIDPAALDNWSKCLSGEVDGQRVVDLGIVTDEWLVTEPGVIRCDGCGAEVVLGMVMTNTCTACTHCGLPEDDAVHTSFVHHDYAQCGADYNSSGQRLAPREQWGWDTGESVSDILMADWPVGVSREEWSGEDADY